MVDGAGWEGNTGGQRWRLKYPLSAGACAASGSRGAGPTRPPTAASEAPPPHSPLYATVPIVEAGDGRRRPPVGASPAARTPPTRRPGPTPHQRVRPPPPASRCEKEVALIGGFHWRRKAIRSFALGGCYRRRWLVAGAVDCHREPSSGETPYHTALVCDCRQD